uniref:Palmdelphin n=1 Tax=Tetraodon nigroviridis TaxID=99883 RepID=H3C024_TETNG
APKMEECALLKERLQAITEKHRVQEDIRQKKLELDQEKLRLQHLKKRWVRDQWLLQDSAAGAPEPLPLLPEQQQSRALQLRIHRIEMEVESLERAESMISTNESLILNRLKAVEKSSEEIIKEQGADPSCSPLHRALTRLPRCPSFPSIPLSASHPTPRPKHTQKKCNDHVTSALFAMEINVTRNLLTGEKTVVSTATVPAEDLKHHAGIKVYDDGRKCVYALNSQEGSDDLTDTSKLSASEVEELLRSATVHRQASYRNLRHNRPRQGNHGNHNDLYSSYQEKRSVLETWPAGHHKNAGGANGGPLPRSQNQEVLSLQQPQLCYTPASYIPLSDYVSVDEDELLCFSPDGSTATAVYSGPAHPERAPSPLYADDAPYTILNYVDATEPITAIFMGFQLTQDDSGQAPECEASLKAELVVIHDDSDDETAGAKNQPGTNGCQAGSSGGGDRRMQKQVATGTRIIKKKHNACCAVS